MATSLVDAHGRKAYPAGVTGLEQFTFVALNSSGQLVYPSANGLAIGILDDAPPLTAGILQTNGEYASGFTVGNSNTGPFYGIVLRGQQKVYAAAVLAPGVPVATNALGQAVAATGSGTYILGYTTEGCNSGDLVQVQIGIPSLHN